MFPFVRRKKIARPSKGGFSTKRSKKQNKKNNNNVHTRAAVKDLVTGDRA